MGPIRGWDFARHAREIGRSIPSCVTAGAGRRDKEREFLTAFCTGFQCATLPQPLCRGDRHMLHMGKAARGNVGLMAQVPPTVKSARKRGHSKTEFRTFPGRSRAYESSFVGLSAQ